MPQNTQSNRYNKRNNTLTAADLGMVPSKPARPAVISRMEPVARVEPDKVITYQNTKPTVTGTHTDRAKGFVIAVTPLALSFALASTFTLATAGLVPIAFGPIMAILFLTFSASWLCGFIANQLISTDGVMLVTELLRHKRLQNEQNRIYDILENDNDA